MTREKKTWNSIFEPAKKARGLGVRSQQEDLGNAVISALFTGDPLVAEAPTGTGKSLAVLIPLIDLVRGKSTDTGSGRAIVSTETNALLDQYVLDDLPFLKSVYKDFTFAGLKGRTHYVCLNASALNARGNKDVATILHKIEKNMTKMGDGERSDLDRVLGYRVSDQEWSWFCGSPKGCTDFKCTRDECFSTRARERALKSNIVVTNNAMLRVDAETRSDSGIEENFLGPFNYLVVDEAHSLEKSLIDGWTGELTEWELHDMTGAVEAGVGAGQHVLSDPGLAKQVDTMMKNMNQFWKNILKFYTLYNGEDPWDRFNILLKTTYVGNGDQDLFDAMVEFESTSSGYLEHACETLELSHEYLKKVEKADSEEAGKLLNKVSRKSVRKGIRRSKELKEILSKLNQAIDSKDGIFLDFGVPHSVVMSGFIRKNGDKALKISTVPLDISTKAQSIWRNRKVVLVSATLQDAGSGGFSYLKISLGIPNPTELVVDSPFDYRKNQRVYVTTGNRDVVDVPGAQYSFEELLDVLNASTGRSLVLFTAKSEMLDAAEKLTNLWANGKFDHAIYVQDGLTPISVLAKAFREDTSSVLIASKSLFTGANFVGDTLSQVVLCKYTNPQYNALCKAQTRWWRTRGVDNWYEMQGLTVFRQACGRLIRTETDRGVVSILDKRSSLPGSVQDALVKGVRMLNSPIIRDVKQIEEFLNV